MFRKPQVLPMTLCTLKHRCIMLCSWRHYQQLLMLLLVLSESFCVPEHGLKVLCCKHLMLAGPCSLSALRGCLLLICRSGKPCSAALIQNLFQLLALSKSLKVRQHELHLLMQAKFAIIA